MPRRRLGRTLTLTLTPTLTVTPTPTLTPTSYANPNPNPTPGPNQARQEHAKSLRAEALRLETTYGFCS